MQGSQCDTTGSTQLPPVGAQLPSQGSSALQRGSGTSLASACHWYQTPYRTSTGSCVSVACHCLRSACVIAALTRRVCLAHRRAGWQHSRRAGQVLGPRAGRGLFACSQACRPASSCGRSGTRAARTRPRHRSRAVELRRGRGSMRGPGAAVARTLCLPAARWRWQQACRCDVGLLRVFHVHSSSFHQDCCPSENAYLPQDNIICRACSKS